MHQLNRAMSKIISVEDDLVSNDELNPEVQIEKTEIEKTIVRPKFNIDTKKLWIKRWKLLSCCLGIQCVIFVIVVCILATQYANVKRKLKLVSKRTCKDTSTSGVNCGRHISSSCMSCHHRKSQAAPEYWCKGECMWDNQWFGGRCVTRNTTTKHDWYMPGLKYTNFKVFRIEALNNKTNLDQFDLHDIVQPWNENSQPRTHVDILVRPDNVNTVTERLKQKKFKYKILIENVQDLFDTSNMSSLFLSPINNDGHRMTWDSYHSNEDINEYLSFIAKSHSGIASLESIGESYEGRVMKVLKLCKGGCGNKPAMWIDGGIHAREWVSPATVTFLIKTLLEESEHNRPALLDKLDWYFLPVLNPDGYVYTFTKDRLWRKNRQPSKTIYHQVGCIGTDLNRNWGYRFDDKEGYDPDDDWDTIGQTDCACDTIFHGGSAFSAPETNNVRKFIMRQSENSTGESTIKFYNSLHAFGQMVVIPWGFTVTPPPHANELLSLAKKATAALTKVHGTKYKVGNYPEVGLYRTAGGAADWALGPRPNGAGIKYSMNIELRPTTRDDHGFVLPPGQIVPTGEEVWAFHLYAAEHIIKEFGQKQTP